MPSLAALAQPDDPEGISLADLGAFEAAAARARRGVKPEGGRTEGAATKVLENYLPHVAQGLFSLPERATEAAGALFRQGDVYDPAPAVETALMTMGATPFSAPRGAVGSGMSNPLFHGSPKPGLTELAPSTRGPLGPGVYTSPAEQIAKGYAWEGGPVYELPAKSRDVYMGAGHRTDQEWFGFKNDKERLLAAAEPEKRAALSEILDKTWSNDGYPAYQRIRQLYGGTDEAAHGLFKKAGFEGISGLVDGPETLLFGAQSLKPSGIRAYHGSPHDFERFDLSKIGTGEGAQAYGHGLYFAGNEKVAQSYKMAGPEASRQLDVINGDLTRIAREMDKYPRQTFNKFEDPRGDALKAEYDRLLEERTRLGRMYEVNINAQPDQFLDWEKPLLTQPIAERAIAAVPSAMRQPFESMFTPEMTGERFYRNFLPEQRQGANNTTILNPSKDAATANLRDLGIPGIKYLDQGSRAKNPVLVAQVEKTLGDTNALIQKYPDRPELIQQRDALQAQLREYKPTSNYVLFRDDIIDILRKYGIAGAAAPALAEILASQHPEKQQQ